jgi:hypothetical protein
MHKHHDTMPKATTTKDKEGEEKKQRKDDSCFPAINYFYKRTWFFISRYLKQRLSILHQNTRRIILLL